MRKRKHKFTDKLKRRICVSEFVTTSGKPKAWFVDKELKCLWQTRILLIFKPTWNAGSTRKLLEVKWFCQK